MTHPPQNDKINALAWVDAIRGWAILGVIFVHCNVNNDILHRCHFVGVNAGQLILLGQYGVQLFFVASAFTLARSWHGRKNETYPIRNFLLRRFFRIEPLIAVCILIYWALAACFRNNYFLESNYTPKAISCTLTLFLNGWPLVPGGVMPGAWSIGTEASFYLIFPFLAQLTNIRTLLTALIVAIPAAILVAWISFQCLGHRANLTWPVANNTGSYFWLPTQLPVFLMGFLVYAILGDTRLTAAKRQKKLFSFIFLASSITIWWLLSLGHPNGNPHWLPDVLRPHFFILSPTIAGLAGCLLILSVALHPWALLVNPATRFIGKISFSLYAIHFIGAFIIAPWIRSHTPQLSWNQHSIVGPLFLYAESVFVCLLFSIPVCWLTYCGIEIPGISLGKRLIKYLEDRTLTRSSS